jgi:hypothetical protein
MSAYDHLGHLAPDIAVAHNRSLAGGESVRSLGLPPLLRIGRFAVLPAWLKKKRRRYSLEQFLSDLPKRTKPTGRRRAEGKSSISGRTAGCARSRCVIRRG